MLLVLTLLAAVDHSPLIAYSCRYYNPPSDSRTTYHQIYLCDVHGRHRRQITFDQSEHTAVRWVGREKLAWLQSLAVGDVDHKGYHDRGSGRAIVLYDLRSRKTQVAVRGDYGCDPPYKGADAFARGVTAYFPNAVVRDLGSERRCVLLKPGSMDANALNPNAEAPADDASFHGDESAWAPCVVTEEAPRKYFTIGVPGGFMGWGAIKLTRDGRTIEAPDEADFIWKGADGWPGWFRLLSRAGSAGSDEWIFRLDWKHGKCVALTHDTLAIDFDPASHYWAASSNDKDRARLGKIWVWARTLWVGDRTTGKQRPIASGAVSGACARVQPE